MSTIWPSAAVVQTSDDDALRTPQWMPAGEPESLRIGAVGPLPIDFDARDGLALAQNELNDFLDLIRDLRDDLTHRPSDMIGGRNPADFRQALVDLQIAAIRTEECKADGGGVVNQPKFGRLAMRPRQIVRTLGSWRI